MCFRKILILDNKQDLYARLGSNSLDLMIGGLLLLEILYWEDNLQIAEREKGEIRSFPP